MRSAMRKSESIAAPRPESQIRGEGKVSLGNYVNVQEGSVVHGSDMYIEDYVTVGHCVVVH